jgi:hypothetical protein
MSAAHGVGLLTGGVHCSSVVEADADLVTNVSALNMSTAALEHRMVRLGAAADRHTVKAIVFYGRRGTVQMLNCYLERNLRRNGGLLSEVMPDSDGPTPASRRC